MLQRANEIDMRVGQRIRQRREFLGMSQGRLGTHLGLTFSQVQKYEKGINRISAGRLYLLAEVLGMPVQYFFDDAAETATALPADVSSTRAADLAVLTDAFLTIQDRDTRRSLIALVCSLAAADPGKPRLSPILPREETMSRLTGRVPLRARLTS